MTTDHFESLARLTPALHDTDGDFSARGDHRAVRAEALRQVRWLQRACARTLSTQTPGASHLVVPAARAGRPDGADGLRQAGEDVPSWFDEGGPRARSVDVASGTAGLSLADLLADSPWVHAGFGADAVVAGDDWSARE